MSRHRSRLDGRTWLDAIWFLLLLGRWRRGRCQTCFALYLRRPGHLSRIGRGLGGGRLNRHLLRLAALLQNKLLPGNLVVLT